MQGVFRVLVIDDHPQDRRLVVRELRKTYPEVELLEAIDQRQLDSHLKTVDLDVVVTDYHLQWSDGIRVLRAVKHRIPNCPVIMFTATGNEEIAVEAMKQGLDDYIIKKHSVRLCGAVESAVEHARTRARADQWASRPESQLAVARVSMLSRRERDVLEGVVAGNANKVIAHRLDISVKTVEKHRANLMKKLRVRSVAELVRLAILSKSSPS